MLELLFKYFIIFEETTYGRVHRSKFPNFLRFPCYLSNFLNSIKPRRDSRPEIDYTFNVQLFQIQDKAYVFFVCHYWKPSYRLWFSDQASGEFIDGKRKHKSGGKRNINAFCHLRRKILWKVYLSCFLVPRPANMFPGLCSFNAHNVAVPIP